MYLLFSSLFCSVFLQDHEYRGWHNLAVRGVYLISLLLEKGQLKGGRFCQKSERIIEDLFMSDKQIIYSMSGVGKVYNQKHVLKDISLGYYYGAKIGVLGLNAGKSTLLKILAGLDDDHLGETTLSKGYTIGYLEQEPALDEEKTVREIVQEGVQEVVDLLAEFEDINTQFETADTLIPFWQSRRKFRISLMHVMVGI